MSDPSRAPAPTADDLLKAIRAGVGALALGGDYPPRVLSRHIENLGYLASHLLALIAADADRQRIDWLESEHTRVDPVLALVVKQGYNREANVWANCPCDVRKEIDFARNRPDAARSSSSPTTAENSGAGS